MAKQQKYLGIGVVKQGDDLFVDCGLLSTASNRKAAEKMLREFGDMKPLMVLTEKEAREMYDRLTTLLNPPKFTKKQISAALKELRAGTHKTRGRSRSK